MAIALSMISVSAFAADVTLTVEEDVLNAYAAAVLPVGGAGRFDTTFTYPCSACAMESRGHCIRWTFQTCVSDPVSHPWTWNLTAARFEISPTEIVFHGTVAITVDGRTSFIAVERNAYAFYHAPTKSLGILMDFLVETQVPVYRPDHGEQVLIGTFSPYKYFNTFIPLGVANVTIQGRTTSGTPQNTQVILQNHSLRIESDVQFSS